MKNLIVRSLAAAALSGISPVLAQTPATPEATAAATDAAQAFAADRAAILAMAGNYKVVFDMRETTPWRADYSPIPSRISGGHESVRVIADTGRSISLQHLLVVKDEAGKTMVIKHWRQDWTYEPEKILVYAGKGRWNLEATPVAERAGRWSQTVWQTDDSPRYGGWGRWTDDGGVRRWTSNPTWRPLARRDAVRNPPYDRYLAINRHSPSPAGWIHWQDNIKMGADPDRKSGRLVPFVQESVLNSYISSGDFDVAAADAYWAASRDYWAAIRAAWDAAITRDNGVSVTEVAETGSAGADRLMRIADDVQAGRLTSEAAIRQGRAIVAEVSSRK